MPSPRIPGARVGPSGYASPLRHASRPLSRKLMVRGLDLFRRRRTVGIFAAAGCKAGMHAGVDGRFHWARLQGGIVSSGPLR